MMGMPGFNDPDSDPPNPRRGVYLIELEPIEDGWLGTVMPPSGAQSRKVHGHDAGEVLDRVKPVVADCILSEENKG